MAGIFGQVVGRWRLVGEGLRALDQYDVLSTEYVELHAEASSGVPKLRVVFNTRYRNAFDAESRVRQADPRFPTALP